MKFQKITQFQFSWRCNLSHDELNILFSSDKRKILHSLRRGYTGTKELQNVVNAAYIMYRILSLRNRIHISNKRRSNLKSSL